MTSQLRYDANLPLEIYSTFTEHKLIFVTDRRVETHMCNLVALKYSCEICMQSIC